jgi:outer membrane protein assembly factor BamB
LCLNAADGAVIWNATDKAAAFHSPPAVANGKVFVGVNAGGGISKFCCFYASTGLSIWNYTLADFSHYFSSPAVGDGKVSLARKAAWFAV